MKVFITIEKVIVTLLIGGAWLFVFHEMYPWMRYAENALDIRQWIFDIIVLTAGLVLFGVSIVAWLH